VTTQEIKILQVQTLMPY